MRSENTFLKENFKKFSNNNSFCMQTVLEGGENIE